MNKTIYYLPSIFSSLNLQLNNKNIKAASKKYLNYRLINN